MLGASSALSMKENLHPQFANATQATAGKAASAYLAPQVRSKSTQGTVLKTMVRV
jgi:hypothetical protein